MGQNLSQPVTEKVTEKGENANLYYGVSSMQGWRVSMEDAHATILDLKPSGKSSAAVKGKETEDSKADGIAGTSASTSAASGADAASVRDAVAFFAVYDGHGGDRTALFAGEHTHELVAASEPFAKRAWGKALQDGFLATDRAILDRPNGGVDPSGCAATSAIITSREIVCGNAGDSRTVLGVCGTAKPLSFDHKPDNEGEKSRISNAGGFVEMSRVNGNLALSRALGDFSFKTQSRLPPEEQVVTAYPDVIAHPLSELDEFVVLACDGIWDCMTSQEVVEFVRRGIAEKMPLEDICELLMEECLAPESDMTGIGCDNMTVCLVALLQGKTKEQWYDMIAKRVAAGEGPVATRTTEQIRAQILARNARADDEPPHDVDSTSSQMVLQQLLGASAMGGGRLNPEATTLLSRLGIRLISAEDDEATGLDSSDDEENDDDDNDNENDNEEHDEGKTPRDEW